jgi:hypothetical protein
VTGGLPSPAETRPAASVFGVRAECGFRPAGRPKLTRFVVTKHEGISLPEIGELTDRAWREVANILDAAGVPRRPSGAQAIPGSRRERKKQR